MVAMNFNTAGIVPDFNPYGSSALWGNGWHKVVAIKTGILDNRDKSKGQHLGLTLKCIEAGGPATAADVNTEAYLPINVYHADPATAARGAGQLTAILFAMGIAGYNDTDQMLNLPFWIENIQQPSKSDTTKMQNNFTNVRNLQGQEPGKGQAPGGAPQMAAPQMQPQPAAYQPPAPPQPQFQQQPPGFTPPGQPAPAAPQYAPAPVYAAPPAGAPAPASPAFQPQPQQQAPGGWQPQQQAPAPQPQSGMPPAGPGNWQR